LKLPNTSVEAVRRIVGDDLYDWESSLAKPPTKKNKRSGGSTHEEGSAQGNPSTLSSSRG